MATAVMIAMMLSLFACSEIPDIGFMGLTGAEGTPRQVQQMLETPEPQAPEVRTAQKCDDLLRATLVLERSARGPEEMQALIDDIQKGIPGCQAGSWDRQVQTIPAHDYGCFQDTHAMTLIVGNFLVPSSLRAEGGRPMEMSGRDENNNILIYWQRENTSQLACWMYLRGLNSWSQNP